MTVATKQMQQIADSPNGLINDYDWSPKGNYVAYSMNGSSGAQRGLYLERERRQDNRVTPASFNSQSAAFDPSGNYLYFLSDHEFAPQISGAEFNYATNRTTQVYALALRKDTKNPFPL